MNERLFMQVYHYAKNHFYIRKMAIFLASHTNKIFAFFYIIGVFCTAVTSSNHFIRFLFVPLITMVYNSLLRKLLNRPRPFNQLDIKPMIDHEDKGSCPSNHAAAAMVISMAWFIVNPVLGIIFTFLAILTGVSRVMVGVHFPFDVLLGWIIGITIGVLGFILF